jgi:hypothetical protein
MRVVVMSALLALCAPAAAAGLVIGPYVQDVRPDGFTIVYETDAATEGTVVVGAQRVTTSGTRHEARVNGLSAHARHRYQVLLDGAERAAAEVVTAPERGQPFTFMVYGDTRNGGDVERTLVRAALAEAPEFALHTGDIVPRGDDEEGWASFFANEAPLLAAVPFYPTVGNHELYKDPGGDHFRRFFVLPDGGRERRYYSFTWGSARFIVLDGNGRFDEQTTWLEQTLATAEREGGKHVFVLVHQSPLSTGGHCGAGPVEEAWVRLFERHPVRAVFGGHDHCYQRLERMNVRYFITGGGGAKIYQERASCPLYDLDARRVYATEHHYLRVKVSGDDIEVVVQRLEPGRPPIETVKWRAGQLFAAGPAPPFTKETPSDPARRWPLVAGGGLALVVLASGLMRRRLK